MYLASLICEMLKTLQNVCSFSRMKKGQFDKRTKVPFEKVPDVVS